jgi:hypothetical protein
MNRIKHPQPFVRAFAQALIIGAVLALTPGSQAASTSPEATLAKLQADWEKPPRSCRTHTRWWWPGNALTKADITWQLEQMAAQGYGGVEIMNTWKMYERGNIDYLSPEFVALVQHAVAEAKRLDLEVAITFSPGWSFGGPWVPREDQSKVLCVGFKDLAGGMPFRGALPQPGDANRRPARGAKPEADPGRVIAVVAARLNNDALEAASLVVLTNSAAPGAPALQWEVPPCRWRLMAFWLKFTGQECQAQSFDQPAMVIDHLDQGAVQRYCDYLGGQFTKAVGDEFGRTIDSLFCDSFEIHPLPNSLLWSTDTLAGFKQHTGYDLTPYLPAIWFDIGALTPRVRYDLGEYLHTLGLKVLYQTFNGWCAAHGVQARIQPHYRFTPELVQAAGSAARPETEVTTARFDPIADPRKATTSGARFYGRDFVSAESYTFIRGRYSTDLQDLKMATDAYLRDGITQFYNHGYLASPEKQIAPTRDMPWDSCPTINHCNTWWPQFHNLASYVARCCALLRGGKLVADVLIYSPQATAWSERAIWESDRRVMPYGNLAKTLVANGYDFDIVNDDLLQKHPAFRNGCLEINGHPRRVVILSRATVIPIQTLRTLRDFVQAGGTVIALEALPAAAAGLANHEANDQELKQIVAALFASPPKSGHAVFLPDYKLDRRPFNPGRQPYKPTPPLNDAQRHLLAELERVAPPDFALAGRAQSDGLTFIHKQNGDADIYFVTNLQTNRIASEVTFRVTGKVPQRWDAVTGSITPVTRCTATSTGVALPLEFEPWESAFFVFTPGAMPLHETPAAKNTPLPEPLAVAGQWQLKLQGDSFETFQTNLTALASWTASPRTRHFSGTGRYEIQFTVPADRLTANPRVTLDLGEVGRLAEVELNDQRLGVAWMAPYRLDVSAVLRPGQNKLVVFVTNLLINRVSGFKAPTPVPTELQPRLGTARTVFARATETFDKEMIEESLPASGLLGPVQLVWKRP